MEKTDAASAPRRGMALLNGLYAWLLGLALYMTPAFVVALMR